MIAILAGGCGTAAVNPLAHGTRVGEREVARIASHVAPWITTTLVAEGLSPAGPGELRLRDGRSGRGLGRPLTRRIAAPPVDPRADQRQRISIP